MSYRLDFASLPGNVDGQGDENLGEPGALWITLTEVSVRCRDQDRRDAARACSAQVWMGRGA